MPSPLGSSDATTLTAGRRYVYLGARAPATQGFSLPDVIGGWAWVLSDYKGLLESGPPMVSGDLATAGVATVFPNSRAWSRFSGGKGGRAIPTPADPHGPDALASKADRLIDAYREAMRQADGLERFNQALVTQAVVEGAEHAATYLATRHDPSMAAPFRDLANSLRTDDDIAGLLLLAKAEAKKRLFEVILAGTLLGLITAFGRTLAELASSTIAAGQQAGRGFVRLLVAGSIPTGLLVGLARAAGSTHPVSGYRSTISDAFHAPDPAKAVVTNTVVPAEVALFGNTGQRLPGRWALRLLGPSLVMLVVIPLVVLALLAAGFVSGATQTPLLPEPTPTFHFSIGGQ